jgi:hypothetical protein
MMLHTGGFNPGYDTPVRGAPLKSEAAEWVIALKMVDSSDPKLA